MYRPSMVNVNCQQHLKIFSEIGLIHMQSFGHHKHAWIQRGGGGGGGGGRGSGQSLEKHKAIGFLINTGLGPIENHKATKAAFNVGPPLARQRNAF